MLLEKVVFFCVCGRLPGIFLGESILVWWGTSLWWGNKPLKISKMGILGKFFLGSDWLLGEFFLASDWLLGFFLTGIFYAGKKNWGKKILWGFFFGGKIFLTGIFLEGFFFCCRSIF